MLNSYTEMKDLKKDAEYIISKMRNSERIDNLVFLKSRWADEKKYEDFNEYKEIIIKALSSIGIKKEDILSITKQFLIKFTYKKDVTVELKILSDGYKYKSYRTKVN